MLTENDLHRYQHYAADYITTHTHCALLFDMGLGKTVSTLTAVNRLLYEELAVSRVLVVAPKRVVESVWPQEVQKWEHLRHLRVAVASGTEAQRKAAIASDAEIVAISRDNIAWLCGLYGGSSLPFDMLVIDELSSFKNPKSIRFKALRKVQPSFDRIVGLTGTPSPNGLIDLWSQIWLLDRGERLGRTLTLFRARYFKPGARNGHIVYNYRPLEHSDEAIHEAISDICVSMKSEDYLELPELRMETINVQLSPAVRQKYEEFEREQVLELLEAEEVTAVNAAALSNKLLQFAGGAVYGEDWLGSASKSRKVHKVHDAKIEAVKELVEEANGKPVLIAWAYRHERDRIMKALKEYKPQELTGQKQIDAWNRGEVQVMLTHPASGGHGLNLQSGGNTLIWYGQTWSLELYQQLNKRLHRQGQSSTVTVYHLIAEGTIDEDVMSALASKTSKQEGLMQAVKARIDKYKP